jgi:DNA-binding MarR family transcriptional regulator
MPRGAVRPANPAAIARDGEPTARNLSDRIGFHLRLAQEASFRAFSRRVGLDDLKPRWFSILAIIDENPGINQTALSRAAGRDKSSLTPSIYEMERRGLLARERVAADRRAYTLNLTADGQALLARLREHADQHDGELDRILGPLQKKQLLRMLAALTQALEDDERS